MHWLSLGYLKGGEPCRFPQKSHLFPMILIAPRYFRMEKAEKGLVTMDVFVLQNLWEFWSKSPSWTPNSETFMPNAKPKPANKTMELAMGDFPSSGSGTTDPFSWLEQILFFLHCDKRVEDDKTINISPLRTEVAGWGIPTKLQWWLELWGFFPQIAWKKSGLGTIWSNYSDLTRVFTPKWWFSKGNPLI